MNTTRRTFLCTSAGALAMRLPSPAVPPITALFPDFRIPSPPVMAKLADFVQALHLADAKLEKACDEFTDTEDGLEIINLIEAQASVRVFARIFGSFVTGPGAIPPSVMDAIAGYRNQSKRSSPHLEGSILAVKLAYRWCIVKAIDLETEDDGLENDTTHEMLHAAACSMAAHEDLLQCMANGSMWGTEILTAILAGKPIPSHQALRAELLAGMEGKYESA